MDVLERIERGEIVIDAHVVTKDDNGYSVVSETEFDDVASAELLRLAKLGAEVEKGLKIIHSGLESIRDYQFKHPHLVADRLLRLTEMATTGAAERCHIERLREMVDRDDT